LNAEDNQFKINDIIRIDFPENMLSFSGIQILEDYYESTEESILTKNSIDLIPYVSNFFPGNINSIKFYTELYNSKKVISDDFLIRYYIKEDESGKTIPNIARFKRMSAEKYLPILGELNIESLPSGNYQLVIEVLDKDNKKRKEVSYFFQRSKPLDPIDFEKLETFEMNQMFTGNMEHPDSLTNYIKSLRPIANEREKQFIDRKIKSSDVKIKQRFFYSFWFDRNPGDPGNEWDVYYKQVKLSDKLFGTRIKKGFESDRGRVFLAYGSPDDTYQSGHEPSAYPYEIWSFYKIQNQRNKKFVFYNPNLAGNDYELLHSNLRGELQTPNWHRILNKRNNDLYNQDVMQSDDQWGNRALEYYNSH
jgi:GWxTD domain-containing protein